MVPKNGGLGGIPLKVFGIPLGGFIMAPPGLPVGIAARLPLSHCIRPASHELFREATMAQASGQRRPGAAAGLERTYVTCAGEMG